MINICVLCKDSVVNVYTIHRDTWWTSVCYAGPTFISHRDTWAQYRETLAWATHPTRPETWWLDVKNRKKTNYVYLSLHLPLMSVERKVLSLFSVQRLCLTSPGLVTVILTSASTSLTQPLAHTVRMKLTLVIKKNKKNQQQQNNPPPPPQKKKRRQKEKKEKKKKDECRCSKLIKEKKKGKKKKNVQFQFQCCFTSTETIMTIRDEPRTSTWLSHCCWAQLRKTLLETACQSLR